MKYNSDLISFKDYVLYFGETIIFDSKYSSSALLSTENII